MKKSQPYQISNWIKMLPLLILMLVFLNIAKAQFGGGSVSVNVTVISADTCQSATGSFCWDPQSGIPTLVNVTNLNTNNQYFASPSDPQLFENLPAGDYLVDPVGGMVIDPISGEPIIPIGVQTQVTIVATNTRYVVINLLGCGSYTYNGITYTQNATLHSTITNGSCIEHHTTNIQILPFNNIHLISSNNSFNCKDSSLLSITGNNTNHIQSINWMRNSVSFANNISNILVVTAGGNGSGSGLNQFNSSLGIAYDAQGYMYVSDYNNSRVLKFPPNSTSYTQAIVIAGGNGSGSGLNQLTRPAGIFVRGNFLYVCDYDNFRVMKYPINPLNNSGAGVIAAKNGLSYNNEVFVTTAGEIYVSEHTQCRVSKFAANSDEFTQGIVVAGSTVGTTVGALGAACGNNLNQLDAPVGIWVANNGDLYIADRHNHRIVKWPAGATSGVVVAGGNGIGNALNQFNHPVDIAFDAVGNMYVSEEQGARVMYFQPNSNSTSLGFVYMDNTFLNFVGHIAFNADGNLNISDGGNYRVVMLNKIASNWVHSTGTYFANVTFDNGCTETVGPIQINSNVIAITDTARLLACDSIAYKQINYTNSTTLFDTLKTIENCDSIYRVVVITINQPSTSTTNTTICTSALPYNWNGNSYNVAGTYTVTLTNAAGCDSVATLNLTTNVCCVNTSSVTDVTICTNQLPYTWNGNSFNAAGTHNVTLTNAAGCDSIATLNLTTNVCCVTTYSTTNENFCFTKKPFIWNGSNYYTSGSYTVKLVNANGCDSLATLNLVVGTPTSSTTTETACDSYTWNGNTYTTSGTYNFNTTNSSGCDSTATLFLTINASPVVTLSTTNSPCDNPKILSLAGVPAGATVQWLLNNQTFNTTGISNTGISTLASGLNGPVHIAKDAADNIYVADYSNDRIIKIAATTNIITVVAGGNGRGNASNQLNQPSGVSLDGNDLIIADHWNHRIVRWTIGAASGATIAGNGFANATAHQLAFPLNAIVDASGNLYVADRNNHRIQQFAPGATNGVTVAGGNNAGPALNQLNLPNDIDLDINGDLIISDRWNARIVRWKLGDAQGSVEAATGLSQPLAVYIAPNGTKYVTDVVNNTVTKWNVGATTGTIVVGNAQSILNYPSGVTIANDGCVVVSQYNDNSVKKYCGATNSISTSAAGSYTATITANGCTTTAGPLVITMPSSVTNVYNYDSCNAVTINGVTYTSSTTFNTTIQDINGCDSVINQYYINVTPIEDKIEIVNVEGCGSVTYNGTVYTNSTNFYDTISFDKTKCVRNINDVNITVNPWGNIYDTVNIEGCGTVTQNGVVYTTSISKNDTTIADCARYIHTLNITVTPWTIDEETTTYTGCGSVQVGDIIYNSDTTLYDTIIKPTGCVKKVYITIIDVRAYQYNVTTTNLSGCGSILYNGITYTSSTILSDTVDVSIDTLCKKNVNTVNIIVTPWTVINDTTRLNGCGSITYKDNVYTASTTLNNTTQNTATCTKTNTTVIITVTPWVVYNDTTRLSGCDSVIFNTVIYRNNDTIRTTNVREDSCLTRNRVVIITVNPSPVFTLTNTSGVCDRPQNISVNVNGGTNGQTITWTYNGNSFNPTMTNSLAATTVAGGNNSGSNANQFNSCLGLLLDAQGRIYVGDYLNHRVQRFPANSTSTNNGITYAGGNGLGINLNQFNRPAGICFDAAGNLYVADYYNARVLRFPANSTSTTQGVIVAQKNLSYVNDVFVDDLNRTYVVDHLNNRVTRFPANSDENTVGTTVAGLSTGNTANNLNNPVSVFVDANYNVIVADKLQHRVLGYPSNYTTIQTTAVPVLAGTGTAGSGVTELNMPVDVMFDPQGRMYVTEEAGNRIIRFPANSTSGTAGTVVYGNNGTTLASPYHMAQDALGRIYIAEGGNFRVIRLDSTQNVQVNQTGTYTVTVTNQFGCSSTQTINVTIPPVLVRDTARLTGCGKVTNPITNTGYTTSTILRDTTRTANGCDSLIKVTIITVTPWNIINDTIRVSGCSSVLYNNLTYTHNDTLRTSIIKEDSCLQRNTTTIITVNQPPVIDIVNTSNACDSVQTLNINGYTNGSTVQWFKDGVVFDSASSVVKYNSSVSVRGNFNTGINDLHWDFNQFMVVMNDTIYKHLGYWGNNISSSAIIRMYGNANKLVFGKKESGVVIYTFCFDNNRNLYMSDITNHQILKLPPNSDTNTVPTIVCKQGLTANSMVKVDNLGRIYVHNGTHILRFPSNSNINTVGTLVAGDVVAGNNLHQINPNQMLYFGEKFEVDENYNIYVLKSYGIVKFLPTYSLSNINAVESIVNVNTGVSGFAFDKYNNFFYSTRSSNNGGFSEVRGVNYLHYFRNNGSHLNPIYGVSRFVRVLYDEDAPYYINIDKFTNTLFQVSEQSSHAFFAYGNNVTQQINVNQSGTYTATVTDANGCTATDTIVVTIPPVVVRDTNNVVTGCASVIRNGVTYTTNTVIATDTLKTVVNHCDSVIHYTRIVVTPFTTVRDTTANAACGSFTINGITYTTSSNITTTFNDSANCISHINVLMLTIKPYKFSYDTLYKTGCDTLTYNGKLYNSTTTFNDTIVVDNNKCTVIIRTVNIIIRTGADCACYTNSISLNTGLNVTGQPKNNLEYDDNWSITSGPTTFSTAYPKSAYVLSPNPTVWNNGMAGSQWIAPTINYHFSIVTPSPFVFKRCICIEKSMKYNLNLEVLCDDSSAVFLDGVLIASNTLGGYNWQTSNKITVNQQVFLTQGTHCIEVKLINGGDPAVQTSPLGINCNGSISTLDASALIKSAICCTSTGTVSGVKFKDKNFNGTLNIATDSLMSGFAIQLKNSLGNVVATSVTDNYGQYSFNNVAPGNYTVNEVQQTGFVQSFPSNNLPHNVAVTAGTVQQAHFGNVKPIVSKKTETGCSPFTVLGRTFTSSAMFQDTVRNGFGIVTEIVDYTVIVTPRLTPTISISASQIQLCTGGSTLLTATVTNAGATPTYQWFTGSGNIIAGATSSSYTATPTAASTTYYCVVKTSLPCFEIETATSNNVTIKISKQITPTITISSNIKTTVCFGNNNAILTATITNGGANPVYQWAKNSVNIAGANAANYAAINIANGDVFSCKLISNANCLTSNNATSNNIVFTILAVTTASPITGLSSVCVGSTIQLSNATPGGVWSSIFGRASVNASGLITGISAGVAEIRYTLNNAAGCSAYAVKNITVNAIPLVPTITYAPTTSNPQLGAGTGQFCLNRTFDVVGSPLGGTWTSSNTNVMTVTNLGTINTIGLGFGSLNYRITNNGCSNSRTMSGTVVGCAVKGVSINNEQLAASDDFTMYPNPAKSTVNIKVETLVGKGSIVVTDLYGKVVRSQNLSMGTNILNITNLATGMYFVSMITAEGKTTKKLIVE